MSFLGPTHEVETNTPYQILKVLCNEPDGPIERTVSLLSFTPENLHKLWQKVSQFPTLYGVNVNHDPQVLLDHLFTQDGTKVNANGLFFVVDDFVGIFTLDEIRPNDSASVHYSFFDRRHKGREHLIQEMLRWAFSTFGFRRLNTRIPVYVSPYVMKFVTESLGFSYEGKQKKAMRYNDKEWDVNLYGLHREDLWAPSLKQ
jgi:RimJ/RimL family protein N-acetyltransferase